MTTTVQQKRESWGPQPEIIHRNLGNIRIASSTKALSFALVFLGVCGVGLGGAGVGGLGVNQGWWVSGALSNLNQIHSLILMAGGLGGGILFLRKGIINIVKMHPEKTPLLQHLLDLKETHEIGASYKPIDERRILDMAHADPQYGFAFVVDGTGHEDNPHMQEPLRSHIHAFLSDYSNGIKNIKTQEDLVDYFCSQVRKLEKRFNDRELPENKKIVSPPDINPPCTFLDSPSYKPAMSFVQLVYTEKRMYLLTAQAADTMVVVEMDDGSLFKTQGPTSFGVGEPTHPMPIQFFDITGAKRVIGFSDGFGDYLTFKELEEIVSSTKTDHLFIAMKQKVMSQRQVDSVYGANNSRFKTHHQTDYSCHDDLALFVLERVDSDF